MTGLPLELPELEEELLELDDEELELDEDELEELELDEELEDELRIKLLEPATTVISLMPRLR